MRAKVIKSTGSWYKLLANGKVIDARLRGKIRTRGIKSTNPVAVGDEVEYTIDEHGAANISDIHPRKNYLVRKSTRLSAQSHVIAANLDQAILVISLKKPKTSLGFIDRFLVLTESFRIPTTILINKTDLLRKRDMEALEEYIDIYSSLGYSCNTMSMETKEGTEELEELFEGKTSLIAGHSGVGKSTLLNFLHPNLEIKTSDISKFSNKGKHTTTFVEMHCVEKDTFIIDSPGIKELGLIDMEPQEISHYFVEMRELLNECKFHNCTHDHEPGCAVKKAAEEERIHPARYYHYLSIIRGGDFKNS